MGPVGAAVARSHAVSGWTVGRSPDGDQRGVLRTRSGSPWRDLPEAYGNWKTVYNRHRRWSGERTWERILDELRRGADQDEGSAWTVAIDAGVVRAHQHAAGARGLPPADVDAEVVATTEVGTGGWAE